MFGWESVREVMYPFPAPPTILYNKRKNVESRLSHTPKTMKKVVPHFFFVIKYFLNTAADFV